MLVDFGFGPDEWRGVFIIGLDEIVDVFAQLGYGFEGSTAQRFSFEDREPDLDLIEPGCSGRREVELHVGMTLEPTVIFGLMGIEIIGRRGWPCPSGRRRCGS
jgi:hypothetical protein